MSDIKKRVTMTRNNQHHLPNSSNHFSAYILPDSIRISADETGAYFTFVLHQRLVDGFVFRRSVTVKFNPIIGAVMIVDNRII